jgi:hypothetical protein
LLLYSSKPSLGVFQLAGHLLQANKFSGTIKRNQVFWLHHHRAPIKFSGTVAGEEVEDFCEESFSHTHPLLCFKFCFTLFLLASFYIENPKKLESLVVVFTCLL